MLLCMLLYGAIHRDREVVMEKVATLVPEDLAKRMEEVLPNVELTAFVEKLLEKEVSRRERDIAYRRALSEARSGNGNSFYWDNACGHF